MRFLASSRLFAVIGAIAFCAFTGDIIGDAISDACCKECASQSSQSDSQQEKSPCASCSCAVHNGSAIASSNAVQVTWTRDGSFVLPATEPPAPDGVPPAIDHPPQLA